MSRLNVGSFRHPDATADAITLTNGGDTQINRALGLGGATYGSSGQVLTSAGAGAVPTWSAIPAQDGVWVSEGTAAANSSSSAFQFDNIDADTHTLVLDIAGLTQSGSGDNGPQIVLRFGTTSTVDTGNNYHWRLYDSSNTQEGLENTDSIRLTTSNRTWQNHVWYGHVRMSQVNGSSHWIVSWQIKTVDASVSGAANWNNTGNLSSLRLFQPAGRNWTGGSLHLRGYRL